jgi:hypothetical protein
MKVWMTKTLSGAAYVKDIERILQIMFGTVCLALNEHVIFLEFDGGIND